MKIKTYNFLRSLAIGYLGLFLIGLSAFGSILLKDIIGNTMGFCLFNVGFFLGLIIMCYGAFGNPFEKDAIAEKEVKTNGRKRIC